MTIHGGVPIKAQVEKLAHFRSSGSGLDVLVATPGRLVDVLRSDEREDQTNAALERRLLAALDATGKVDATLSLNTIKEMKLEWSDNKVRAGLADVLADVDFLVLD